MKLEGIHHITAITGNAPRNVEFYAGVLGLRLVKKTVNQDDPTVYHLFYADEEGSPGADLTFFEYPHAAPGAAGAGMVHRIDWRVASAEALDFWERRLAGYDVPTFRQQDGALEFADPEGLTHQLLIADVPDEPLIADTPGVPEEAALQGVHGVRAYAESPQRSEHALRDVLSFEGGQDGRWEVRGASRGGIYAYDQAPEGVIGKQGGGTVHHLAFASTIDDHESWQGRIAEAGLRPTQVIDRFYFRSIYFREPSGVLMEIATIGPGFAVDEDAAHLGEGLSLPPRFESLRERLQDVLSPLPNPREQARA